MKKLFTLLAVLTALSAASCTKDLATMQLWGSWMMTDRNEVFTKDGKIISDVSDKPDEGDMFHFESDGTGWFYEGEYWDLYEFSYTKDGKTLTLTLNKNINEHLKNKLVFTIAKIDASNLTLVFEATKDDETSTRTFKFKKNNTIKTIEQWEEEYC